MEAKIFDSIYFLPRSMRTPVTMAEGEAVRIRTLVRSMAVASAILLVLLSLQTVIHLGISVPQTAQSAAATDDHLEAPLTILGGNLILSGKE